MIQKMKCPECGRRILDIDTKATVEVRIEAECPHCKKSSYGLLETSEKNKIHNGKQWEFISLFFIDL